MKRMLVTITLLILFAFACGYCIRHSLASIESKQRIKEQIAKLQERTQKLGMHNGVEHRLERRK